jgi:iron complex outermembrane receptor protein
MNNRLTMALCATFCFFQTNLVWAQTFFVPEHGALLQDSVFSVEEVTVHAFHYGSRLLETPGAISIIPAQQLELNALQPIDFVLNQLAGVYMQSASLTTNRLTIRGVGSRSAFATNKIRAYFAGIPLTNGVGETTIEDLNQSILSKVEVIKGPASGFYGSGLGGTLLFEAGHPAQSMLSADYGQASFQTHEINGKLVLANEKGSNQFAVEQLSSEGYRDNNQTDRLNLNYVGQFQAGRHEINFLANYTDLKAYIPSSIDLELFTNSPEKAAANWAAIRGFEDYQKSLLGASAISHWKNNWKSAIGLFGQTRQSDELRPFNLLEEKSHYLGGRFVLEKNLPGPHANWKLMFGNESFFEGYDWSTSETENREKTNQLSNNRENRSYFNLFSQIEYQLPNKLRVSAGANVNRTWYDYTDRFLSDGDQSGKHRFKTIVSPRLALNYSLTGKQNLYAQVSHGFSPPSLEETLLPEGGRNTGIQPETGWNYEIGSRGYLFDELFYDVSAYYMRISNLLVARRVGEDAYLGINAGKTAHPGLEYYLRYSLPGQPNWNHALAVSGSFSPYSFVDFVDGDADYSGNKLTGTPRHQNNFSYQLQVRQNFDFQLNYLRMGKVPLRDDNSVYAGRYGLLSALVQYKKAVGKVDFKATAMANNLTDEHYSAMVLINASSFGSAAPRYYYPGTPVNFSFRLNVAYRF